MGHIWLARALFLHAEAAQSLGQPIEPAVRRAVGNAEHLCDPYTRGFFSALYREFDGNERAALRTVVLRQVWMLLRNRQGAHRLAARLASAARKARQIGDVLRLERELPLPPRPPSRMWRALFWGSILVLVIASSVGITCLLAPDFVNEHGRAALEWAGDLWNKVSALVGGSDIQGEQK